MITAICFLNLHRLESNLKSNEQDKNCNLHSIQIAAGDSAWQKKTKAALIHAGVEDIVEFALICVFHGSVGLTPEICSEIKLLHYTRATLLFIDYQEIAC